MTATRVWIGEVELSKSLMPSGVSRAQERADVFARVLVRLHGQFLGFVTVPLNGRDSTASTIGAAVQAQLGGPLAQHLDADGLAMPQALSRDGWGGSGACPQRSKVGPEELISVVVATKDRPAALAACLARLQQVRYGNFEVVVVDNSSTANTQECFDATVGDDARFHFVAESIAGASRARNRGVSEAKGRYVAFTDDDVLVDEWWLSRIAAAFARDRDVGCVTGLVPAAEIDHPAQEYFERRFSWASGSEARVYDMGEHRDPSPLYPYKVGIFGTGANCAVDRDLLERLGGFDEALGPGTPAHAGEDLDVFVRVLRAGRSIVNDPSAIVWHVHRSDARALRRQLFNYGTGLTAFVTKCLADPHTRGEILHRLRAGLSHAGQMWKPAQTPGRTPRILILTEVMGMLFGPLAYLRARRLLRRSSELAS